MGGDTMKIEWMGHACFQISCGKERILLDPFDRDAETGGYLHGTSGRHLMPGRFGGFFVVLFLKR